MTTSNESFSTVKGDKDRIIVALDVETPDEARAIVNDLEGNVGAFKIGLQLFTAAGPAFIREMTQSGHKIFLDLKFHDIPNTVAKASVEVVRLGVWMFNVHAAGGSEMMKQAVGEVDEECFREKIDRPLMIGVTVLTSSNADTMAETGIGGEIADQVVRLARLAADSGMDGVVASAQEVSAIRNAVPSVHFLTVTPGIRLNRATVDDQKRVTTFGEAIRGGSDYVVIGRPITQAANRRFAVEQIIAGAESK